MSYEVRDVEDEEGLVRFLEADRRLTAYALCDLDPPYRANARFAGAYRGSTLETVLLLYTLPTWTALLLFGDAGGADALFQQASGLPDDPFLIVPPEFTAAVETVYRRVDQWFVLRMTVEAMGLTAPDTAPLPIRRLDVADVPAVQELYTHWGTVPFGEAMLRSGVYCGAHDGKRLVAVGGTHAVSGTRSIGAIGGVFTNPEYRGRGLATAVTGAVCHTLARMGIQLMVLNVIEGNEAAIAAYTRLGFETYTRFIEGPARRRPHRRESAG